MNGKLADVWQDPTPQSRLIRRVLSALGLGTLAYFITTLLADDRDLARLLGIVVSVFIGGVALVVQVLIDFEDRLVRTQDAQQANLNVYAEQLANMERAEENRARDIADQVNAGFLKINTATELFGLVEASALRTDAVIQLVKHSTLIDPAAPPLIRAFAQHEIGRISGFLKELSAGTTIMYEGEDRDWMLSLTQQTQRTIDATSLTTVDAGRKGFIDDGLWVSDLGQRYLELQRGAIRRNVKIRRLFIMDRADVAHHDDGFADICRLQQEMGITIRVLDWSAIPGTRRDGLFDFVIFDEVISYEVTLASQGKGQAKPSIVNTRLELRKDQVHKRLTRFRDLWAYGRDPFAAQTTSLIRPDT